MHTTAKHVAVRKPTKGTLVTLWLDEYFAVYKNKVESKGIGYLSSHRGGICLRNVGWDCLTTNSLPKYGLKCFTLPFAPAARIRKANLDMRKDRYIFQKDTALDWGPAVQCRAEMEKCSELVMVTNC